MTTDTKPETKPEPADVRDELARAARHFYQQGWMWGTAGNLSARLPDGTLWITASGKSKGELGREDFIRVDATGAVVEQGHAGNKPSAETSIHLALYARFTDARACFHVHSLEANLASTLTLPGGSATELPLPPLEMLKGFGIWAEKPDVRLPLFDNHLDVPRIASDIRNRFGARAPQLAALLIRRHGTTTWAPTLAAARNQVELIEFLLKYVVATR